VAGSLALRIPILSFTLGALAFWLHFKSLLGAMQTALLVLAIIIQFLIGFRTIATSWLRAHERQKVANVVDFLSPASYLSIGLLLLYLHKLNLLFFFLGILLSECAVTGLAFALTNQAQLPLRLAEYLNFEHIKGAVALLWKPSLILGIVGILYAVEHRLDWLMVYSYTSAKELAFYCLAIKVYEVFMVGISIVVQTLFPWMCKVFLTGHKNPRTVIAFKSVACGGMLFAAAVALYLPNLLTLIWGSKFEESNKLILWLMCGACLEPINDIMYYSLISKGNERYLLVTSAVPAVAQLIVNLILIPHYGSHGATIAMIVMVVTSFLLLSIFSVKNNIFKIDLLAKIFIISIITSLLLNFWNYFKYLPFNNPILIIIIILLLSLSLLLTKSEWSLIRSDLTAAINTFKN
jgi:O-antigen/teichoic acid export membrane protein